MSLRPKLLVGAIFLTLASVALARDPGRESFAGTWIGRWSNSLGQSGDDSLLLSEDADGDLHGTWTGEVAVAGRPVRRNAIELRGQTPSRSYLITATVEGRTMSLSYEVTPLDGSDPYQGTSSLVRTGGDGSEGRRWAHLGNVWTVREPKGWRGTWVRRKGTSMFDAEWRNHEGEIARDVVEIESVRGDKVILVRRGDSLSGRGRRYYGTLSSDGRTIRGTASWYEKGETWRATIE